MVRNDVQTLLALLTRQTYKLSFIMNYSNYVKRAIVLLIDDVEANHTIQR